MFKGITVDIEDIYKEVDDTKLVAYYFGIYTLPCIINSPIRVDNNPSFRATINTDNRISFIDFGTGDRGNIWDLLKLKWSKRFPEVLQRVYNDLDKIKNVNSSAITITSIQKYDSNTKSYNKNIDLKVKVRDWQEHDVLYWQQYGLSTKFLMFCNVYPISNIIIIKNKKKSIFGADKHAYCYVEFKDGEESLKVYQPYNKNFKWKNNHHSSVWDLWEQLPLTGEHIIITSSRKDAMCIWKNTGIPSTGLQAESYHPKKQVIEELKRRFKNVWVLYDNDFNNEKNNGRLYGEYLAKTHDLKQIEIPSEFLSKDPSDLYKNHGKLILQQVINKLINL